MLAEKENVFKIVKSDYNWIIDFYLGTIRRLRTAKPLVHWVVELEEKKITFDWIDNKKD